MSNINVSILRGFANRHFLNNTDQEAAFDEEVDDVLVRLGGDERIRALHDNRTLNISILSDKGSIALFRFTFSEIKRICVAFNFDDRITFRAGTRQRFTWKSEDALALMLRRLVYPARLLGLQLLFGHDLSTISNVFNAMVD